MRTTMPPGAEGGGDQIARCLLGGGSTRVVVATTTAAVREAARRHEAAPLATVALGRGLTAGLLLATLTKDEERVTLQLLGDGPLGGMTVDASSSGTARAYLRHPHAPSSVGAATPARLALARGVGRNGLVSVVRDLGLKTHFRGQTSIVSGEVDEDVEQYLIASEQIDSVLRCDTLIAPDGSVSTAAGLLVQTLPQSGGTALVQAIREHLAEHPLSESLAALSPERAGVAEEIARAALGPQAATLQLVDLRPAAFHCPCSRERAAASLALLGPAELQSMIIEDGRAEVTCNFCRERYEFSESDLERMRRDHGQSKAPPS